MKSKEELMKKLELARVGNGTQTYNDFALVLTKEEAFELFKDIEQLETENQELKSSYESLKKDYWELDKVEDDILQKFLVQGIIISAIQDEIVKKIETETIYEDFSPLCEVTIRITKEIFDMLFEKKEERIDDSKKK